jgi:hypothetical protein
VSLHSEPRHFTGQRNGPEVETGKTKLPAVVGWIEGGSRSGGHRSPRQQNTASAIPAVVGLFIEGAGILNHSASLGAPGIGNNARPLTDV